MTVQLEEHQQHEAEALKLEQANGKVVVNENKSTKRSCALNCQVTKKSQYILSWT